MHDRVADTKLPEPSGLRPCHWMSGERMSVDALLVSAAVWHSTQFMLRCASWLNSLFTYHRRGPAGMPVGTVAKVLVRSGRLNVGFFGAAAAAPVRSAFPPHGLAGVKLDQSS